MIALATTLWPGLAAALLLGLLVGFVAGLPRDWMSLGTALILLLALALLAGLAVLETVPGDWGLWIEAAALMLAVYLAGCALGSAGKAARIGDG